MQRERKRVYEGGVGRDAKKVWEFMKRAICLPRFLTG